MKHALLLVALLALSLSLILSGCWALPRGTMEYDLDADGTPDGMAYDEKNNDTGLPIPDGKPDLDDQGNVKWVPGSQTAHKIGGGVDDYLPTVLIALGSFGVPFVGAIGLAVKGAGLGRAVANLVGSVQVARKRLSQDDKLKVALDVVNQALDETQVAKTKELIAKIKVDEGIESVT